MEEGRSTTTYVQDGICPFLSSSSRHDMGRETGLTSAINIRLNAFAIDASTPTRSNSIDRCDSLFTKTFKFCDTRVNKTS